MRSSLDLHTALSLAVYETFAFFAASRCVIFLDRPDAQPLQLDHSLPWLLPIKDDIVALDETVRQRLAAIGGLLEISDLAVQGDINNRPTSLAEESLGILRVRSLLAAPIFKDGECLGHLTVYRHQNNAFSSPERQFLQAIAFNAGLVLCQVQLRDNTRQTNHLYHEAYESARRDAIINKVTAAVHSSLDPEAVLQAIVNELGAALSVCRCHLASLPDPLPNSIPITHHYTAPCCAGKDSPPQTIPAQDNSRLLAVLSSKKPLAINDLDHEYPDDPHLENMHRLGIRSTLATAIHLAGQPIGFFALHHCEKRHTWTKWEIEIVQAVAEQAGAAIRQAGLYREAKEAATRATLANQIIASIRRSLNLKETLQVAAEEVGRTLKTNRAYFRQLIGQDHVVVAEYISDASLSLRLVPVPAGDYVSNYLMETRRPLIIDDVAAFKIAHPEVAAQVRMWQLDSFNRSQIVYPIFVNDQFWGAMAIAQTDRQRRWEASELALIETVIQQVEVAVSHAHLFEETRRAAQREALLSRLTRKINQSSSLDEIFPIVAYELGERLTTDQLIVAQMNSETQTLTLECEYRSGDIYHPKQSFGPQFFTAADALMKEGLMVCNDVEEDSELAALLYRFYGRKGIRSLMQINLYYKGRPRFAIVAVMRSEPRPWSDYESELMRAAVEQVFTAIERADLFDQVSRGKSEWENTFDALNDGVFIFDQNGILRRVNQAGAAYEEIPMQSLLGRRCCTLLQGLERQECMVQRVVETGRPVTFEVVPEKLNRPMLVTISPLVDDADALSGLVGNNVLAFPKQKPKGAVCIVRDLSELRAAEASAREQRTFLIKLLEHANEAICALSPEGQFIWLNEQLLKLSGYSREEMQRSDYRIFLTSTTKFRPIRLFRRALRGQAQSFEIAALRKTGETRLLFMTYTPIYDADRVTSVLCITRDITEEKLASERAAQADKLRALGQLASGVAHNFNNILAAIIGHAQLMRRDCTDDRLFERLDIIERAAMDGAQTVKRIQGFGLKEHAAITEAVDVSQLVQDSTTLTQARWRDDAHARGIRYEVHLDLQAVPVVQGSPSELREVFVNLILNALDAMPAGGRLQIATEAEARLVKVRFTDTGIGMSREVRDRIFEPFFSTKGSQGMGLGLAVSRTIIERYGGRIEAQNNPAGGTIFTLQFPRLNQLMKPAKVAPQPPARSVSILVVDDEPRVRDALVGMLNISGHRADQAGTLTEAQAKLAAKKFDLVITDLSMPGHDGWAVAQEAKRLCPDLKIILTTGYIISAEQLAAHPQTVNQVLMKPIKLEELSAAIARILN